MVSTDTTRKIETLRKWSQNPLAIDASYLADIANELERVYRIMIERGQALQAAIPILNMVAVTDEDARYKAVLEQAKKAMLTS